MDGIRLKNFRSLKDTGPIKFKPITLFVGRNSSGKSTALRFLPLLKQSVMTSSSSPILWFGELVDFGSIQDVICRTSPKKSVSIEIDFGQISISNNTLIHIMDNRSPKRRMIPVKLTLELQEVDEKTRIRKFTIASLQDRLSVTFDRKGAETSIEVNGHDFTEKYLTDNVIFLTNSLVPSLRYVSRPRARSIFREYEYYQLGLKNITDEMKSIIRRHIHKNTSDATIDEIRSRITFAPRHKFQQQLVSLSTGLSSWKSFCDSIISHSDGQDLSRMRSLAFISSLSAILSELDRTITKDAAQLAYIGPSRATGERYYRIQELAVNNIDPQGRNLAMFLHSLNSSQLSRFSLWLEDAIGYSIVVTRSAGHVQIKLKERESDDYYNLTDMGYGFSQLLPILAQVWSGQSHRRIVGASPTLVAMEQPELHLHPAYQARLADIMVQAVQRTKNPASTEAGLVRFCVETHSESLINRLGELVHQGRISHSEIAIYIFDKSPAGVTNIQPARFDEEGLLKNWPIDFFASI